MKYVVIFASVYANNYVIRFVKGYKKTNKGTHFRSRARRHLVVSIPTGGKSIPIGIVAVSKERYLS